MKLFPQHLTSARPTRSIWIAAALLGLLLTVAARAQTCFIYVDNQMANLPINCVSKADLVTPCAPPSDCTTVVNPGGQTVLHMHTAWHDCFGNTLSPWTDFMGNVNQPVGRGQRWYAFHRQFELDFNIWRQAAGYAKIESLNWCLNMEMPIGFPNMADLGLGAHPDGCGTGNSRPVDVQCVLCEAFPPCLYYGGAGPSCANGDVGNSAHCTQNGITYNGLQDFPTVDKLTEVLDNYFHGTMHGAVGYADGGAYVNDVSTPVCSPRDPMFWRLHKALDDVVRAWQDHNAADIILVIDKSGSMSAPDSGGMTKLNAAVQAARMFADILDKNRTDGQINRIGIVTFSTTATLDLGLTVADPTLLNPGGPLDLALNAISSAGPGGSTGIGAGVQKALDTLCAGGNCSGVTGRKGILLLTDGMENVPPCLGGSDCSGTQFDYNKLGFVQACAVGFGNAGSLDGDLLTLLCERQGGIYMQNPATGSADDLKKFFVMGYGQLTDEFLLADPHGFLPPGVPASEPVPYDVCNEARLTFASGWKTPVTPGALRLIVTTPSGRIVTPAPDIQSSVQDAWDYKRVTLPYRGESSGTWRAHLIRPHRTFVNGFTTDSFLKVDDGVSIVRRQIQRLCPDGATNVLYFEDGRFGPDSVYAKALQAEMESGLIRAFVTVTNPTNFAQRLDGNWDLIVYAHQRRGEVQEVYDGVLAAKLCRGQRAILTENRRDLGAEIIRCAGATFLGGVNWTNLTGDSRLFDGVVPLRNPGYPTFTWGVQPLGQQGAVQALGNPGSNGAVVATAVGAGPGEYWFVGVLGRGLSKLDPHLQRSVRKTGDDLVASIRMLPSYSRAGGYDSVNARVEVTYPLEGLGNIFTRRLDDNRTLGGDALSRRASTLTGTNAATVPTGVAVFPLYDDGTHGDEHPNNQYWTTVLPGLGRYDGMYQFRYILDFTVAGCTTHREMLQSVFLDSRAHPTTTTTQVQNTQVLGDGRRLSTIRIIPRDIHTNMWGPGRIGEVTCVDSKDCNIQQGVSDNGDGSYSVDVLTPPGVPGVRLTAFNSSVDLPVACPTCPQLSLLALNPARIQAYTPVTATILLSGPAPAGGGGGAVVYLNSSDPDVAEVPPLVIVPAGRSSVTFVITNAHGHDTHSHVATITARYGAATRFNRLTVDPVVPHYIPFEITSIQPRGALLEVDFTSPYRIDLHELQMRSTFDPTNHWMMIQAALSMRGTNQYRLSLARPATGQKYFRVRAAFGMDRHEGFASAKLWEGPDLPSRVKSRTVEYRRKPTAAIPDNKALGLRETLTVNDDLELAGVELFVWVQHPHLGDLEAELVSPAGQRVPLRTRAGSLGTDWVGWSGVDLPMSSPTAMVPLIGERTLGAWTLQINDRAAADVGELKEWALRFNGFDTSTGL